MAIAPVTANYKLKKPRFDESPWHDDVNGNMDKIDALFKAVGLVNVSGAWENSAIYAVGLRVFDDTDGTLWISNIAHTAAATGTFAADRAAHPTYWSVIDTALVFRYEYAAGTQYFVGDVYFSTSEYLVAVVLEDHVGAANPRTDATANRTALVVDNKAAVAASGASATASAASATAASNSADAATASAVAAAAEVADATAQASASAASAVAAQTAETNAETAETNAETAQANAETAATTATTKAGEANTSAVTAAASAATATTKAGEAAASAAEAAGYAASIDPTALIPPGASMAFNRTTPPSGWLKENGAAISRTTYATLFAVIGTTFGVGDGATTFNLPDSRGEFIRGLDDGRGVDAGRALGSAQAGQNLSHTHTGTTDAGGGHGHTGTTDSQGNHAHTFGVNGSVNTAGGLAARGEPGAPLANNSTSTAGAHSHNLTIAAAAAHTHTITTAASGGTEARPRNVAKLICIKY